VQLVAKSITMKKQSKTPLFNTIRKAFGMALAAERRQTSAEDIVQRNEAYSRSRRRFLENMGKTAVVGSLVPKLVLPKGGNFFNRAIAPRIAIVGGGIAGLTALHSLKKSGLDATIYESSNRVGGRIFSVTDAMGPNTWTEFGGEFIDTNHADMWRLAEEFGLELMDYAQASEAKLIKEAFFFNGQHYTLAQVVEEFRGFAPRMQADIDKLDDEISYKATSKMVKNSTASPFPNIWSKSEHRVGLRNSSKSLMNRNMAFLQTFNQASICCFSFPRKHLMVNGKFLGRATSDTKYATATRAFPTQLLNDMPTTLKWGLRWSPYALKAVLTRFILPACQSQLWQIM
jgi:hypothetical protein